MSISLTTHIVVPDEHIAYFYELLSSHGTLAAIFQGATTEVELVICCNHLSVRNQLTRPTPNLSTGGPATSPPNRTPLPATPPPLLPSSQQYGTDLDEATLSQLDLPSPQDAHTNVDHPVEIINLGKIVHSVTNRNRRKERERAQKRQQKLHRTLHSSIRKSSPRKSRNSRGTPRIVSEERVSASDEEADAELSDDEEELHARDDSDHLHCRLSHDLEMEIKDTQDAAEDEPESDTHDSLSLPPPPDLGAATHPPITAPTSDSHGSAAISPGSELTSPRSLKASDTAVVAWFSHLKVPKDDSPAPASVSVAPRLQQKMLDTALAIAGPKSAEDWQTFFAAWRKSGGLASRPVSRDPKREEHLKQYPQAIQHFYHTYNRVEMSTTIEMWRAITHRFAMRDLWAAFLTACQTIPEAQLPIVAGSTNKLRSRQRQYLFHVLHPALRGSASSKSDPTIRKAQSAYHDQMGFAKRWHTLADTLGVGVLGLIPASIVSNNWIQKTLKVDEFAAWIQVIRQWNPRVIEAGQHWQKTLNKALTHQKPPRRLKQLETLTTASLKRFHDPTSLFGPGNVETDVSGDEMAGVNPVVEAEVADESFDASQRTWTGWDAEVNGLPSTELDQFFEPGFNLDDMDLSGVHEIYPTSSAGFEQRSSQ